MIEPKDIVFEDIGDVAVFRLTGEFAMQAGVHLIRDAIALARERHLSKLMIVITETTGYASPSLSMRLAMMREWADAAAGYVRVVMVCRPEFIDPNKFGITMAANFGMRAEVFSTEDEALAWMREEE
jgi:hypothetical protein